MKSPNLNKTASSFQAWYALPNPTCRLFQWVMLFFFCIYYVGLHVVLHISDSIEHLNFKVWVDFSASIPICFKQSQRTPSPQEQLKTCEDMKCLRRLMDSGWVREWLLPELSLGSSAMLNCRFRRSTKNIIYNIYIFPLRNLTNRYQKIMSYLKQGVTFSKAHHFGYPAVSFRGCDIWFGNGNGYGTLPIPMLIGRGSCWCNMNGIDYKRWHAH